MKFVDEYHDVFEGERIFWVGISGVPQSIQEQAKQVDGEQYNPKCFGICVYYNVANDKFELSPDEQGTNIYYVDSSGEKHWYLAGISDAALNDVYAECKKRFQDERALRYKPTPTKIEESRLLYRLEGEAAERHGAIGYMRADFGGNGREFHSTWFDSQTHLKTYDFKKEFEKVINSLRDDGQFPPFASRANLETFCNANSEVSDYSVKTPDYSYYFRFRPMRAHYDIYCYAYDNRWLLPELAGQHELPEMCYSTLSSSGDVILIKRGEKGYYRCEYSTQDEQYNKEYARDANIRLGVTRAQEEAMYVGSIFKWDSPAAKPWNYDKNGNLRPIHQPKKNEPER